MLVGLRDFYPINLEGESDGIRENGNRRIIELIKKGKKKMFFLRSTKKICIKNMT